ncbi:MAG: hypothetical protein ACI9TK_001075 [Flavobacteriaceae bacterium]|jgi:hypothetical protein
MATNKRPVDFTTEDITQLIRDNRQLRFENSLLKGRTQSRDWKEGGFTPKNTGNPLLQIIKKGEHISEYTAFFQSLSFVLAQAGVISKEDTYTFQEAFNGFGTPAKCEWLIQKNLCVYLIDVLNKKQIISYSKINQYTTQYFGIIEPSKLRSHYKNDTDKGKPRNYETIDKIVEGALEMTNTTPIKLESPEE